MNPSITETYQADLSLTAYAIKLAETGRRAEAHQLLRELADRYPRNTTILLWLVRTSQDLYFARQTLQRVEQIQPEHPALVSAWRWLIAQEEMAKRASLTGITASAARSSFYHPVNNQSNQKLPASSRDLTSRMKKKVFWSLTKLGFAGVVIIILSGLLGITVLASSNFNSSSSKIEAIPASTATATPFPAVSQLSPTATSIVPSATAIPTLTSTPTALPTPTPVPTERTPGLPSYPQATRVQMSQKEQASLAELEQEVKNSRGFQGFEYQAYLLKNKNLSNAMQFYNDELARLGYDEVDMRDYPELKPMVMYYNSMEQKYIVLLPVSAGNSRLPQMYSKIKADEALLLVLTFEVKDPNSSW